MKKPLGLLGCASVTAALRAPNNKFSVKKGLVVTCHERVLVSMGCNTQGEFPAGMLQRWSLSVLAPAPDADLGRCLAADGLYLYTTNSVGRGISKLGSGLHGTLR